MGRTQPVEEKDDISSRSLSRKQVMEMLRKGRSLAELDIRGADLAGVCFDNADLRYAKLADANLSKCSFKNADLTGASLWHANLKEAVFDDTNLEYADLDCANIDGCTFLNARIKKTIFPSPRTSLLLVQESIRSGIAVRMARNPSDELDEED